MKVKLICKECGATTNVDATSAGGLSFFLPSALPDGWLPGEAHEGFHFTLWASCPTHRSAKPDEQAQRRESARKNGRRTTQDEGRLLHHVPMPAAVLTGPQHVFELANPMYEQMVGRDVVGKTYAQAFPELVGTPLPDILDRVYEHGKPYVSPESLVRLDRDGDGRLEEYFFKFNLEPLRDAEGKVYGMVAAAIDITGEVSLRRALVIASSGFEAIDARKDEISAMLGHEPRNPLEPTMSAVALTVMEAGVSDERAIIEQQLRHVMRAADDLLDVSRLAHGKTALVRERLDVARVIADACEATSHAFAQRHHRLSVTAPKSPYFVRGDRVRLTQIFSRLLENAAKYTDAGGEIDLTTIADEPAGEIVVRIRDSGRGIAPELVPRIFNLFEPGRRANDRSRGGLGLGLAIVKYVVGLHSGSVSVSSEGVSRGSAFTVRLPVTTPPFGT